RADEQGSSATRELWGALCRHNAPQASRVAPPWSRRFTSTGILHTCHGSPVAAGLRGGSDPRPFVPDPDHAGAGSAWQPLLAGRSQEGLMPRKPPRFVRVVALCGAVTLLVSGCTLLGGDDSNEASDATVVELATHDSWSVPDDVIEAFEQRHDIDLRVRKQGDAGELTNKLVLTK